MFGLRAAVQHDEDLEVVVGLAQAGGNRLREVCVALVGRDAERHTGGHGSPLFSAEGRGGFRAPSPTLSRRARGRPRPRVGHRQAGHVRHQRRRRPRPARGLPAHGGRERLHPDPVGGDDALRRLQRPRGRVPAVGGRRGRFGGEPRRVVDRLRGRLLRSSRAAREAREVPAHHALAPRVGRPLVRALRRAGRLLQPDAADHPHLHLAAGRRRADAVLEVQRAHARAAACPGSSR